MREKYTNVDDYINSFPAETRKILKQVREAIKKTAPGSTESISYGMPAYKLYGKPLVYFAGYDKHIGFYATPKGHSEFASELKKYKQGKGSVQFPVDQPVPLELISRITKFKLEMNALKVKK